jgi:hypothetical protein
MNIKELVLGQEITIHNILKRKKVWVGGGKGTSVKWEKQDLVPCKAIVVGIRTLFNGHKHYEQDEGYYFVFDFKSHFQAVLVVTHIRKKPFYTVL